MPPGKVIAALIDLPEAFFFSSAGLERLGVDADRDLGIFLRDRDALAVQIEPRQDVHRRRHVVLRHLAGGDEVRHRRQDVRAVDAVALGAEHEVVARRAPRSLLLHFDVGHAVFREDAFLLGDEQRRRIGQRDEAELGDFRLGAGSLRDVNAERKCFADRGHQGARAGGFKKRAPVHAACRGLLAHGGVFPLFF